MLKVILICALFLTPGAPGGGEKASEVDPARPKGERRVPDAVFSEADRWLLTAYGSAAVGKTSHQVYAGHLGLGYRFSESLALNLESVGYFVDHAQNTGGGGLSLLPRWHFIAGDGWSFYLDGGWGFIYTQHTLRDPGTHFNFTLQGGAGATLRLSDRFHAMAGARWFHISNARIRGKNRNVGFDSPMFYLGLMMPLDGKDGRGKPS